MSSSSGSKATARKRWIALGCALVVLIAAAVFLRSWYSGYRAWHAQAAPLFSDIEPSDGTAVYAGDAWIRWSSPVAAKGRILWAKQAAFESTRRMLAAAKSCPRTLGLY